MAANINRVVLTGRLTRDPELRTFPSGMAVCSLRLAFSTRKKDQQSGEWGEKSNYIDVSIWGRQGEMASQYLVKGRAVALDGRLEWREFQDGQGNNRQAIELVADNVEFLGGPNDVQGGGGGQQSGGFTPRSDVPADTGDFGPPQPAPVGGGNGSGNGYSQPAADDDIPF